MSTAGVMSRAQASNKDEALAKEAQTLGYWVDPSTGLMWAKKDNGKNVNWHQATSYCRKMRVSG